MQTFIDSNISRNFAYTMFDNQIQSVNLTSKINYINSFKKFDFYIKNFYSSAVTKLEKNFFRDFDNVKTGIGYNHTDNINTSVNYLGFLYSDQKNINLKGSSSSLLFLSGYYENNFNSVSVFSRINAGYKLENQIGEYDKGINLSGEFDIQNINLSEYFIDANIKAGYENLKARKNNFIVTKFHAVKSFSDNLANNEFDGYFSRTKKDFYFSADPNTKVQFGVSNNTEKRTETLIKIFDRFDYTISDKAAFVLIVNPHYRNIVKENLYIPAALTIPPSLYDTEIQELTVAGDAALNLNFNKLTFQLKLSYTERDENFFVINQERINNNFVKAKENQEATKNNHSSKVKLGSNVYYSFSDYNRLELSGSTSLLRYDTPSDENFDDRDELNIIAYFAHRYDNLKNLLLITSVDLNLYHTVYIFSEKSSNNNWNRILRLTSRSFFTPHKNFRTINTVSVLANYTVYDFEDILTTIKSFSFRQFNLKDSTIFKIAGDFWFRLYGELKLYERGELNWSEFSSRPINYFEDKIINPEINYYINKFITLSGGYRFFEQRRFNYINGERVFNTSVKTHGPVAKLRLEFKRNSLIEVITSYDYYTYGSGLPGDSNGNLYMNVIWNF
ncbi:MAG: hypothetical protein ACRDFC_08540 [Ignavibacteria bacterium]